MDSSHGPAGRRARTRILGIAGLVALVVLDDYRSLANAGLPITGHVCSR
jgi:hypothetical protein